MPNNPLIQLITDGRIRSLADLRTTYHRLVMQTQPDAVGSDKFLRKFIDFSDQYEEANRYLAQLLKDRDPSYFSEARNHRLEFYRQLHLIESLELPYAFNSEENGEAISAAKRLATRELSEWKPEIVDLYAKADADHVSIKNEKPRGPYSKHALALNIRPIIHNVCAFHLTGQEVYARQSQQNLDAIMQKVADQEWSSLYGLLTFLIEDLKNGAAIVVDSSDRSK